MPYLSFSEQTIADFSDKNIDSLYSRGFLFTRVGKGHMYQTRSVRVDLSKFELSSENRRVLKKTEELLLKTTPLPHPAYDWHIHKMGHDFYKTKFGEKTFTANKLKELMTEEKNNFNLLLSYTVIPAQAGIQTTVDLDSHFRGDDNRGSVGYCICFETPELLHYCYPFYDIRDSGSAIPNIGLGMMLRAIIWSKEQGKKYVSLGSASRPSDTYKLQFAGVQWWDGARWSSNIEFLKSNLKIKNLHNFPF